MADKLYEEVTQKLFVANQSHLLKFCKDTDYLNTLQNFDFIALNKMFKEASEYENTADVSEFMEPLEHLDFWESEKDAPRETIDHYRSIGMKEIANGKVAALVIARDGTTPNGNLFPMGMYEPGFLSEKSLFQWQAESILRLQELSKEEERKVNIIPWYIMSNVQTAIHALNFFEENSYFGLNSENVIFFEQDILPAFSLEGKILLRTKNKLPLRANGTGGLFDALNNCEVLNDMTKRNITHVFVYNVDNMLVKLADPVFIGFCIKKKAEVGIKVVRRTKPNDPVDIICFAKEALVILEHKEIPKSKLEQTDKSGNLVFNTVYSYMQTMTLDFLKRIVQDHLKDLPYHLVKEQITCIDSSGDIVNPLLPNGFFLKKCIYDCFAFSKNFVVWEVSKTDEFSPIRIKESGLFISCTIATSDYYKLQRKHIEAAGGKTNHVIVEISPLISYSGENLEQYVKDKVFTINTYMTLTEEGELVTQTTFEHSEKMLIRLNYIEENNSFLNKAKTKRKSFTRGLNDSYMFSHENDIYENQSTLAEEEGEKDTHLDVGKDLKKNKPSGTQSVEFESEVVDRNEKKRRHSKTERRKSFLESSDDESDEKESRKRKNSKIPLKSETDVQEEFDKEIKKRKNSKQMDKLEMELEEEDKEKQNKKRKHSNSEHTIELPENSQKETKNVKHSPEKKEQSDEKLKSGKKRSKECKSSEISSNSSNKSLSKIKKCSAVAGSSKDKQTSQIKKKANANKQPPKKNLSKGNVKAKNK